ncbi:transcription factor bHLH123-like isoform X1 [Solanum tuberosum]|uniref:Transcription factor n=1 Tax=Solanum tuberosum TaxID=4113 RepID=M1CCA8_SOLTU|nr:PREDICTED: transcription factor bHLH123-like isoform X1 [Solanum tuberosum]
MAEEFQLGGGNWWENNTSTSSRNRFDSSGSSITPTTSTSATTINYSSNWPIETDHVDIKPRAFLDSVSVSQSSAHDDRGGGGGGGGGVLSSQDSNFQIMGLGLTSQPHDWNHQSLLNYEDSSSQMNIRGFSLDQNNSIFSHSSNYEVVDNHQVLHSSTTNSWSKFPQFLRTSPSSEQPPLPPPAPPLPPPHSQLHFSNNTPFWNASAASMTDVPSSLFPSNLNNIPQLPNNTTIDEKAKNMGEVRDINKIISKKTTGTETSNKRPRNETATPSPAFKVRKEKMGDRITTLQQLVSPFGKTDTASVLSEAIEYIKFLHDQIGVLSAPYMESGASMQHLQSDIKSEDVREGRNKDLRSRGLCLVPISSTFPVTHETNVDLWTPTFGSTFR